MRDERAALCNAAARWVLPRPARSRCARAVRAAAALTAAWRAVLGIGGSGKAYDAGVGAGPPPPLGVRTTPPPPPPSPRVFRGGAGKRGGGGKRGAGAAEGAALVCAAAACSLTRREDLRVGSASLASSLAASPTASLASSSSSSKDAALNEEPRKRGVKPVLDSRRESEAGAAARSELRAAQA